MSHEDDCPYNYGHNCSCLKKISLSEEEARQIEKHVKQRKAEAYGLDMDYDIETDSLVPYSTLGSAKEWENGDRDRLDWQGYE